MTTRINRRRLLQGLGLGALATRGYAKQQSAPAYFTHNVALSLIHISEPTRPY